MYNDRLLREYVMTIIIIANINSLYIVFYDKHFQQECNFKFLKKINSQFEYKY